tara:strand:- start:388 stop:1953 length:1566 start_codon:yes stop_codon:yes gene_type:complete
MELSDTDSIDELLRDVVTYDSRVRARRKRERAQAAAAPNAPKPRTRKKRAREEHPRLPLSGEAYPKGDIRRWRYDPSASTWWALMKRRGVRIEGSRAWLKFKRKFRLPLDEVEKLVAEAQKESQFADKPAGSGNGRGPPRHPLIMKVLAALRCLAKGVDPEGVADAAHLSEGVLNKFIPSFIKWLGTKVYDKWVTLPEGEELEHALGVFTRLGFPGAYCNTDGVHLSWDACPAKMKALFIGKEGYPTLAFNVSVLQSRLIIHVADWLPGSKNDKTQAQHDELFAKLRFGKLHPDRIYILYDAHGRMQVCKGLYAIVDGGYHAWRCLQSPLSIASGDDATAWNERLESVRKAVECVFGILKKRFRILRNDFECQDPNQIAYTFRACCALHNILLKRNGQHMHGSRSHDWLPARMARARDDLEQARCKHVVRGPRNVGVTSQREPGHAVLREQLIMHYNQMRQRREAGWLAPNHAMPHWAEVEVSATHPHPHPHPPTSALTSHVSRLTIRRRQTSWRTSLRRR